MPIVVEARSEDEFKKWVAEQKAAAPPAPKSQSSGTAGPAAQLALARNPDNPARK